MIQSWFYTFYGEFVQCVPAIKAVGTNGDDHQAIAEACAQLQVLENELKVKGTKFFGGDNIGLVDIAADFIAYWHGIREEAAGVTFFTKEKFPKLTKWAEDFVNNQAVKNTLPPREQMLGFYMKFFGKVNGMWWLFCWDMHVCLVTDAEV